MIKNYTAEQLESRMLSLGMQIPDFGIIGVRSAESVPNKFDDSMYTLAAHKKILGPHWCTTNPGNDYLLAPLNPKGAAILVADKQYVNCFKLGLHKGKDALIQCGDLLVYRDNDKDIYAEELGVPIVAKPECRIDIHQANEKWTSVIIGKWSAGCQVVANPIEYAQLLKSCRDTSKSFFTYTLLKEF